MTDHEFDYAATVTWTGNTGAGTASYQAYDRTYDIQSDGKPVIAGSSDPAFRGAPDRYNPEDLLIAALSACHMLWFLHLCADAGITVLAYEDRARARMRLDAAGGGRFVEATLRPTIVLADPGHRSDAAALHHTAHDRCFIANSVNFPVRCEPTFTSEAR